MYFQIIYFESPQCDQTNLNKMDGQLKIKPAETVDLGKVSISLCNRRLSLKSMIFLSFCEIV